MMILISEESQTLTRHNAEYLALLRSQWFSRFDLRASHQREKDVKCQDNGKRYTRELIIRHNNEHVQLTCVNHEQRGLLKEKQYREVNKY